MQANTCSVRNTDYGHVEVFHLSNELIVPNAHTMFELRTEYVSASY